MPSRRDFLKQAALLAAGAGFPAALQKAFAIDPAPGSTFLDAEHVVILMQENRSFDHAFGTLRGVRGFNDPRAVELPNGNPVWLQTNQAGETYGPFRLNIRDTRITWMGSLPHSRASQVAARNAGRHDGWLDAKRSGHKAYARMPLTMGHYAREDIPFYYALADAFTICDQNFCSALTSTIPNRLYLWSGTIRHGASIDSPASITNELADHDHEVSWRTFPERLEAAGISWRVYQNEIDLPTGLSAEEDRWLGNYGDNPLEYFTQFGVRYSAAHRRHLEAAERALAADPAPAKQRERKRIQRELARWTAAAFAALPAERRAIHEKAFATNAGSADYRRLVKARYRDGAQSYELGVPQGDILHGFREDVQQGRLPAVSWLVPPERYSDHPSSPWYGMWYLSEVFDILTRDPAVWQKTIFILCYDENDGYFDHVPPFMAPHPHRAGSGMVSSGIDAAAEQLSREAKDSIGLGFRVPMVVASPWSRGGYVCSQVFDQTSILRLLETVLSHRTGRELKEENLTAWRRTVCGDLTAAFRPDAGERLPLPQALDRTAVLEGISRAQFRPEPGSFRKFSEAEIAQARENPGEMPGRVRQEPGTRPACALPYELAVDGQLDPGGKSFSIRFAAGNRRFGGRAAGAPFRVYTPAAVRSEDGEVVRGRTWDYAVAAGDALRDRWNLEAFPEGGYDLRVSGPNGFYREFRGDGAAPRLGIALDADGVLTVQGNGADPVTVVVEDLSYGSPAWSVTASRSAPRVKRWNLGASHGWYDFAVRLPDQPSFRWRFAGHVETGAESVSDPAMA